jgi:hypothetical protein
MGCFRIVVTIGRTRIAKCCAQEKVCNSTSLNDVTGKLLLLLLSVSRFSQLLIIKFQVFKTLSSLSMSI